MVPASAVVESVPDGNAPTALESVTERERREEVSDAVLGLPSCERHIVILHYSEGLPLNEIARRLAVHPATIGRRLKRALGRLRVACSEPVLETLPRVPAASVARTVLLTGSLAALPPEAQSHLAGAVAGQLLRAGAGLGGGGLPARLVLDSIHTVAGLKVAVGAGAAALVAAVVLTTATVQHQRSRVDGDAPRREGIPQEARDLGPAAAVNGGPGPRDDTGEGPMAAAAGSGEKADTAGMLPEWLQGFEPRGVLSGRIVDPEGLPAVGVTVALEGPGPREETRTDAAGDYWFDSVPEPGLYRIRLTSERHACPRRWGDLRQAEIRAAGRVVEHFVVEPGGRVFAEVVDDTGAPVAGARVRLTSMVEDIPGELVEPVLTDGRGLAQVGGVPVSSNPVLVTVVHEDYAPGRAVLTLDDPETVAVGSVSLSRGEPLTGRATCSDGGPAAGWGVYIEPEWWHSNSSLPAASVDETGVFSLQHVVPGLYTVRVRIPRPGGGATGIGVGRVRLPPEDGEFVVHVPRPSPARLVSVSGEVRFEGQPLPAGQTVEVSLSTPGGHRDNVWVSSDRPEFVLDGVPRGTYTLRVSSPLVEPLTVADVQAPSAGLSLTVRVTGRPRIALDVRDAESGAPVSVCRVRAAKLRTLAGPNYVQSDRWVTLQPRDGRTELEVVGPGLYRVQVATDEHAWVWSDPIRSDSGETVAVRLPRGVTVTGRVVEGGGDPVPGATVSLLSRARGCMPRTWDVFTSTDGAATTDEQGRFTVDHVLPGSETVRVSCPGFCAVSVSGLDAAEGADWDLRLKRGGGVYGTVYSHDGRPQADVTLFFQDAPGYGGGSDEEAGRLGTAVTDRDGDYEVAGLPERLCYVRRMDSWEALGVVFHAIVPRPDERLRLDLGSGPGLRGTLGTAGGSPDETRLLLSGDNPHFGVFRALTVPDPDGGFVFRGVPPGRCTLYARTGSRPSEWLRLADVTMGREDLSLGRVQPPSGALRVGIRTATGEPFGGHLMVQRGGGDRLWSSAAWRCEPGDEPGTWQVPNLVAPGTYTLVAQDGGEQARRVHRRRVQFTGEDSPLVWRLPAGDGAVVVAVPEAGSVTGPEACLLWNEDRTLVVMVSLADSPSERVDDLPAGTYSLGSAALVPWTTVEVPEAGDVRVAVEPPPDDTEPGSEAVVVRLLVTAKGIPVQGADVTPSGDGVTLVPGSGPELIVRCAPGRFTFRVAAPGFEPRNQEVVVPPPGDSRVSAPIVIELL
jgi:hypothetical protein